ncbi:conserved hypothetical protein [Leishmania infantum JPCM5]|uniref:Uncharacterized protein n=3 Tax=Leishmania donovani species complex TaxID=38574 RepID=A4I261_LEIIN|nr:conserved hypothetical protein [Leishmania infantum JPCM5]XP_003861717.1 hypothetical protein, conserved [Leishmania donovani]CAC9496736.1 hypothetical_protein_-_conserved [Leishmania infantum]AYU79731.1 hypothetical protein LdCL_260018600 [Leishmania donovani]TPP41166.1 hypothetical protein CGC21_31985 [Leishmania donovani]CAM68848.1 conserved hypothetical protein [Leishmania infantum JPCM5]CBZ35018.1 hypothetical protein, conserved [Leishmania donovani]|eukprot:XP_001470472.1 conserved hypothetical protein [Leishmania infantum JPCM5]
MKCSAALCRVASAVAAAVPKSCRNTPYTKKDEASATRPIKNITPKLADASNQSVRCGGGRCSNFLDVAPVPPPASVFRAAAANGSTFIDPSSSAVATSFNNNCHIKSFRQRVCTATDVSMRPLLLLLDDSQALNAMAANASIASAAAAAMKSGRSKYGDVLEQLSCRWAAKFYGKVTYGPRNYPYPSSRWLARRFQMKKHRILKRFRFRRYKLAAVANLPFAKMIRVGMLPELKSSKTKKGDTVDMGLSSQLVSAARSSAGATKTKGKRTRPKSKYQV